MIEIKNICAGYGKDDILRNLSLSAEKGEITAIIGKNGCGKTTLFKVIMGLLKHRSGEISIDGKNTVCLSQKQLAGLCAYLPQTKAVPDMTVETLVLHGRFPHLGYPRRYTPNDLLQARQAMQTLEIEDLAHTPVSELSGGTRQKAYLAMALCTGAPYILLDEPTTFLDVYHQLKLCQTLKSLAKHGKGVVAVMHDLPLALSVSDRIAVMKDGDICTVGTADELVFGDHLEKALGVRIGTFSDNGQKHYFCAPFDDTSFGQKEE